MEKIKEQRYQELKDFLAEEYKGVTSERRINELAENLFKVLEETDVTLKEFDWFLDDFEGGVVRDGYRYRRLTTFMGKYLTVNRENAQRLFEYLRFAQNETVYFRLLSDFYPFLSEEQIKELADRADEFPMTCPFLYGRR